ncbi:MAG: zinc ribbon domain-containing protein [Desulfobacterales bacterium]|nr:zinc ribbon domain-containing protein [Desulfobacterales bacterium]
MPRYDFHCRDCEKDFTTEMHVDEYEKNKDSQKCPECGSENVKRKITEFETQTSKKS